MPIILGVQICTTHAKPYGSAGAIIGHMENLLERRRRFQIGRRGFLISWGKLRVAIRLTPEYKALIELCKAREAGMCEFCHKAQGVHMHHVKPVAFYPKLVLCEHNVKWTCEKCHPLEDRRSRKEALGAQTLQTRLAERTQIRSIPAHLVVAPKARSS